MVEVRDMERRMRVEEVRETATGVQFELRQENGITNVDDVMRIVVPNGAPAPSWRVHQMVTVTIEVR